MTKSTLKIAMLAAAGSLFASAALAGPVTLDESQLDAVAAGGNPEPTGFVCPVITTGAIANAGSASGGFEIGATGYYTIAGPLVDVPDGATNGDGEGFPSGNPETFSKPGDTDYTAVWGVLPPS